MQRLFSFTLGSKKTATTEAASSNWQYVSQQQLQSGEYMSEEEYNKWVARCERKAQRKAKRLGRSCSRCCSNSNSSVDDDSNMVHDVVSVAEKEASLMRRAGIPHNTNNHGIASIRGVLKVRECAAAFKKGSEATKASKSVLFGVDEVHEFSTDEEEEVIREFSPKKSRKSKKEKKALLENWYKKRQNWHGSL